MMLLEITCPTGGNRSLLFAMMRNYRKTLIICAPTLVEQWNRVLRRHSNLNAEVMSRQEYLMDGAHLDEYDFVLIEDYPMFISLPRNDLGGLTMVTQIITNCEANGYKLTLAVLK